MYSTKTKIITIVVLIAVAAGVLGGYYIHNKIIDSLYNAAVKSIQNNSYEEALIKLEKANHDKINRKEFLWDASHNEIEGSYKNTIQLYAYAISKIEYQQEIKAMSYIRRYLKLIEDDYNGDLAKEINAFKESFKTEYDKYLSKKS